MQHKRSPPSPRLTSLRRHPAGTGVKVDEGGFGAGNTGSIAVGGGFPPEVAGFQEVRVSNGAGGAGPSETLAPSVTIGEDLLVREGVVGVAVGGVGEGGGGGARLSKEIDGSGTGTNL